MALAVNVWTSLSMSTSSLSPVPAPGPGLGESEALPDQVDAKLGVCDTMFAGIDSDEFVSVFSRVVSEPDEDTRAGADAGRKK